jgi:hypothetical protein
MPPKASTSFDQVFAQATDTHIPLWASTSYATVPSCLQQLEAITAVMTSIQPYQNSINYADVAAAIVNRCTTIGFIEDEDEDSEEELENDAEQPNIDSTDSLLPAAIHRAQ